MSKLSKRLIEEAFYDYDTTKKDGRCPVRGCKNKSTKNHGVLCYKHRSYRATRIRKTEGYYKLKYEAGRRGKEFSLTVEQYLDLLDKFGYDPRKKGKRAEAPSFDRIDVNDGYHYYNLQVISVSDNAKKRWEDHALPDYPEWPPWPEDEPIPEL